MNNAALETFREIAYAMRAGEPQDWQWIGEHMSQRMFGITETQATTLAQRHGGVARRMPILPPAAAPDATFPAVDGHMCLLNRTPFQETPTMTTTTERSRKNASAEIGDRINRLEAAEKAPNYLAFRSALARVMKSCPPDRVGSAKHMTTLAMDAYKAKDYAKAAELRDDAAAFAQGGPPITDGEVTAVAGTPRPPKAATPRKPKAEKPAKPERGPSALDLAAAYLKRCTSAKTIAEITKAVLDAGWKTTGKTPGATLNAAIIREIKAKGSGSRFTKSARGLFESIVPDR